MYFFHYAIWIKEIQDNLLRNLTILANLMKIKHKRR